MKWTIDKSFDFCYGHRVHNQSLNEKFTSQGDTCLKCRHLHGHQGKVKIVLESDHLVDGMVTDFKHLGWFKDFIDDVLDHKFIVDINDPLLRTGAFLPRIAKKDLVEWTFENQTYWTINLNDFEDSHSSEYELYEGMVFVDFVPTSENLTSWLAQIASYKMNKMNVKVSSVEFWETPKSHCRVDI